LDETVINVQNTLEDQNVPSIDMGTKEEPVIIQPAVEQVTDILEADVDYEHEHSSSDSGNESSNALAMKLKKRERRKKKKLSKKFKSLSANQSSSEDELNEKKEEKAEKEKLNQKSSKLGFLSLVQQNDLLGATLLLSVSALALVSAIGFS